MSNEKFFITIPDYEKYGMPWRIVDIDLKLRMKYGLEDVDGWGNGAALSKEFDEHSFSRGPSKGIPTISDFSMTLMMNSGIRTNELSTLNQWLFKSKNIQLLNDIRDTIIDVKDLREMKPNGLIHLGNKIDSIRFDRQNLSGINVARIFKWLAAWAPEHIPMLDALVFRALTGENSLKSSIPSGEVLRRFREILDIHYEGLFNAGEELSKLIWRDNRISIPPVRVLDNCIWFDWDCAEYKERRREFQKWIDFTSQKDCYPAKFTELDVRQKGKSQYQERRRNGHLIGSF